MHNTKNKLVTACIFALWVSISYFNNTQAQTEFFSTKINFPETHLANFYSSISIDSTQVYFNANDFTVYAHDKNSGILNWSYYSGNKSDIATIFNQNSVFVTRHFSEYYTRCVQLNSGTGDTIQTLNIESLSTKPHFRGNLMFCTAVSPEIGGAVFAYDLSRNSIAWQKSIAHGISEQPYYLENKIIVNAEGDNWIKMDYDGTLTDTICENKLSVGGFYACVKHFQYLTHNQKEITASFLLKHFNGSDIKIRYAKDFTFILGENKILILGNSGKITKKIAIDKIITLPETGVNEYREILKADDTILWFYYKNIVVVYDYKRNKTVKTYDLGSWDAHQVVLDGNNLWLITKENGELVGVELESRL